MTQRSCPGRVLLGAFLAALAAFTVPLGAGEARAESAAPASGSPSAGARASESPATPREPPEQMDAADLPNYLRVNAQLAVGGQPSLETLARLEALGFRTVITLRAESEGPDAEQGLVEGQGIAFVRVPVAASTFSSKDVDTVAAILENPRLAPVLLHCGTANRVGGLLAVIEARRGKSAAEAESEGKRLGLASEPMLEATRKVIASEQD